MNKFRLSCLIAIVLGTASAWAVNYKRYGHRTARFGPFTMSGDVTPDNAIAAIEEDFQTKLGKVDLPNGSKHDFGVMAPNTEGSHTFVVKNVGDGDLKLRIGASSCKCTIGSLESDTLAPGEQTEVKLEWTVKPAGMDENTFSQTAQLLTNDPSQYGITLQISGNVISEVEMVPAKWSFGEVAAGEPFEISGKIYTFYDAEVVPTDLRMSDKTLDKFSTVEIEPFEPGEQDGIYQSAKQGFDVKIQVEAGLRQGAVSQNFLFGFRRKGEDGEFLPPLHNVDDPNDYAVAPVTGRIVGALGMIPNARVSGQTGGGYIYEFGEVEGDEPVIRKSFVVLKGSERENTKLSVGEVTPEGVLKARLGEPTGRGTMTLYPLEIEVVPGDEPISRMGKNKDDYGNIWIESDNPKVTKMRIAVKFAVEAP